MGKLMLWLSTPGIDYNAVILSLWANPTSTLLDLIDEVGASQSNVDYYTDRLSSDWAARR
jgi:LPS sulfotransferase NodH